MKRRQTKVTGQPDASRSRSASTKTDDSPDPELTITSDSADSLLGFVESKARSFQITEGLNAIIIAASSVPDRWVAGLRVPATCISAAPDGGHAAVRIFKASGDVPGWVGNQGGTIIAEALPGGGQVLVTTYGIAEDNSLPSVQVRNLNDLTTPAARPSLPSPLVSDRPSPEIASELIVHIERQGDRRFSRGWAGNPGQRLRLEAFSVKPLEVIAAEQVEYMAFGPGGRQTQWLTSGILCGTRGRRLPLTGFAVRLAPALRDRFGVIYEGFFFDSGSRGPYRDGEPCLPSVPDDPLSAIRLRFVELKTS